MGDESGLVLVQGAVGIHLLLVDEHRSDDSGARWRSSVLEDVHVVNGVHFGLSGEVPHVGVGQRHCLDVAFGLVDCLRGTVMDCSELGVGGDLKVDLARGDVLGLQVVLRAVDNGVHGGLGVRP